MFTIEMLPAFHGDSLWIEYGSKRSPHRVLIDGGLSGTFDSITARAPATCPLELFCVTHIDQDHIEGAVKLLANLPPAITINDVWHNGYKHIQQSARLGAAQAEKLQAAIENHARAPWNAAFQGGPAAITSNGPLPEVTLPGGLRLTLLSPGKTQLTRLRKKWDAECAKAGILPGVTASGEDALQKDKKLRPRRLGATLDVEALAMEPFKSDTAPANGASIAFLAEYGKHAVLFAADAHSPVLEASIGRLLAARNQSRLTLDAFKLSHHGSKSNNGPALFSMLDCPSYLVSTNGDRFDHPDPETIARILVARRGLNTRFWFNYHSGHNAIWDVAPLKKHWKYRTQFPDNDTGGIKITL
ncbi:MAG: hypothetical protein C0504_03610 [Candidatus Solibacter sp.]|nr:hypothetical protein [Candidatus Solibacter sp.]